MSTFFWNMMQCISVDVHLRFGDIYSFLLQSQRVSQVSKSKEGSSKQLLVAWHSFRN
jgi:hypothetical protein